MIRFRAAIQLAASGYNIGGIEKYPYLGYCMGIPLLDAAFLIIGALTGRATRKSRPFSR